MLYSSMDSGDVHKYYAGTYIYLPYVDQDNMIYVEGADSSFIYFGLYNGEKGGVAYKDGPFEINFQMPHKQYYGWNNEVYHFCRKPARQWKKGIQKENTILTYLDNSGIPCETAVSLNRLQGLIKPQYSATIDDLKHQHVIALSPRLAASKTYIFLDHFKVAKINLDKSVVMVMNQVADLVKPYIPQHYKVVYV